MNISLKTKQQHWIYTVLSVLIVIALLFELFRDAAKSGDFIGYVNAGNALINGDFIYNDYLNTWPPFFSYFSIPLAWADNISSYGSRFLWLGISIYSLFYINNFLFRWLFNQNISLKNYFYTPIVIVINLIMMRFIMDNLANVQINILLLAGCLGTIQLEEKGKSTSAGLLLGFLISLKIYPVFILAYFFYNRSWRTVITTIISLFICNGIVFLHFGIQEGYQLFKHWIVEVAGNSHIVHHKNQGILGGLLRFLTEHTQEHTFSVNVLDLSVSVVKKINYALTILLGLVTITIFKLKKDNPFHLQEIIILTAIPMLSPVAWKAYFIFQFPAYLLLTYLIFKSSNSNKLLKALFFLSILLNVISSELFTGPYLSDVFETFSAILIGNILLTLLLFYFYFKLNPKIEHDKIS